MTPQPWWKSWKLTVSLVVTVLTYGAVLTLAILGQVTVTSAQILEYSEWVLAFLLGGHVVQQVGASISTGIAARAIPDPAPAPAPAPVAEEEAPDAEEE
jgi:hypothetical protein